MHAADFGFMLEGSKFSILTAIQFYWVLCLPFLASWQYTLINFIFLGYIVGFHLNTSKKVHGMKENTENTIIGYNYFHILKMFYKKLL